MFRLYLGNLAGEVNEETLHELFASEGLSASNILVKRGYAFVDCLDQATFDKAIESFNGKNLTGCNSDLGPQLPSSYSGYVARKQRDKHVESPAWPQFFKMAGQRVVPPC